jgi:hypothetical protein
MHTILLSQNSLLIHRFSYYIYNKGRAFVGLFGISNKGDKGCFHKKGIHRLLVNRIKLNLVCCVGV